jgi:hypothetical protein
MPGAGREDPTSEVIVMKAFTRSVALALIVSIPLVSGGCATSDEWTTWRAHPSHFASAVHMASR